MAKVRTQAVSQPIKCCGKSFVQREEFIFGGDPTPPPVENALLLQDGTNLLLQDNTNILLQ
jgi:hypothetical protein